jgi:membrane dipeptidase
MIFYSVRILLILVTIAACYGQRQVSDAEVREVHRSALLIDTHNDVTSKTLTGFDIGQPSKTGHTDLPRLREGGVGAVFFAAYVAPAYAKNNTAANRALQMIDTVRHDIVERHPHDFVLALTADDIVAAHKNGKIAALIGIEGGHAIEDSPRLVRDFYALGVRYMTLTHTNTNHWADSSGDMRDQSVQHHNGLTDLGKQVIREMNRAGMIVDISHVADKTFWDALETSQAPIFASHSSCRALCDVPRNMTDEMIAALAKKHGVIQINFSCGFLTQSAAIGEDYAEAREKYKDDPEKLRAALAELRAKSRESRVRATLADVVAHIDHAVKIAGIDAVGIGSDFDGVTCTPEGLDDVSKFPNLTRALLAKGYSAADIRKIYGGNTLRLMREVEKARGATPP